MLRPILGAGELEAFEILVVLAELHALLCIIRVLHHDYGLWLALLVPLSPRINDFKNRGDEILIFKVECWLFRRL